MTSTKSSINKDNGFQIGDVVVVPDKAKIGDGQPKTGTVVSIFGNEMQVLDANGVIHQVKTHEAYLEQNNS